MIQEMIIPVERNPIVKNSPWPIMKLVALTKSKNKFFYNIKITYWKGNKVYKLFPPKKEE
jgi:hypothetical protein